MVQVRFVTLVDLDYLMICSHTGFAVKECKYFRFVFTDYYDFINIEEESCLVRISPLS